MGSDPIYQAGQGFHGVLTKLSSSPPECRMMRGGPFMNNTERMRLWRTLLAWN